MQIPTAGPNLVGGRKGTDLRDTLPKLVRLPSLSALLQEHISSILYGKYLENVTGQEYHNQTKLFQLLM